VTTLVTVLCLCADEGTGGMLCDGSVRRACMRSVPVVVVSHAAPGVVGWRPEWHGEACHRHGCCCGTRYVPRSAGLCVGAFAVHQLVCSSCTAVQICGFGCSCPRRPESMTSNTNHAELLDVVCRSIVMAGTSS
jgi:hypothetical protein